MGTGQDANRPMARAVEFRLQYRHKIDVAVCDTASLNLKCLRSDFASIRRVHAGNHFERRVYFEGA